MGQSGIKIGMISEDNIQYEKHILMRKATQNITHISKTGVRGKKTWQGRRNVGTSTMPKRTKQTYKKYRGQGK